MSMGKEFADLQKAAAEMWRHAEGMEKIAFDPLSLLNPDFLSYTAAPFAAGEVGVSGLKRLGRKQAPALLRGGIDLGREGQKTNLYLSDFMQTALGQGSAGPLTKGEEIGGFMRERGMDEERSSRFLDRLSGINAVRRKRMERDHILKGELDKLPKDQVGDALQQMLQGKGQNWLHKTIVNTGINEEAKRHIGHDLAQLLYVVPGAYAGDSRFAIRPIMRRIQGTKLGNVASKLDRMIETKTQGIPALSKAYSATKKYIDE